MPLTLSDEQLTSIAGLVDKSGESWLAGLTSETEEELTPDVFVETFTKAVRDKVKTVGGSRLKQGVKDASKLWSKSIKEKFSLDTDSTEAEDIVEAMALLLSSKEDSFKAQLAAASKNLEDLDIEAIKNLPAYQEAWRSKHDELLNKVKQVEANAKKQLDEKNAEVQQIQLNSRKARLHREVLATAHQLGIDLGDPAKDKDGYQNKVSLLMYHPDLSPTKWGESEDGKLYPVDSDGNHRQNEDFHPMTLADVVSVINPFGIKRYDNTKGSPNPPGANGKLKPMDHAAYTKQKEALLAKGDRKGAAELAREFISRNTTA